ncbi:MULTISPECIES: 50S ribosomal protein L4 [unclassified Paraflavitalea]|uniref:50S ribosomal protein L4 n=1 Tax=unclassified Paraflavitalea TaxID=2798305 RepID=UPI003D340593
MQVDVLNISGKKTGRTVDLPEEIFGIEPNDHVIYLAVKQYLAAQRQGTHKVKTRLEVKGSSKKLHRQKGTGGSRKGNIRNPLYKGGGTIFGPKPRDYDFKLNQKVKGLAKCSALSYKVKESNLVVVEDVTLAQPKTKELVSILKSLNVNNKKVLVLAGEENTNLYLSFRNIPNVVGYQYNDMNTYDIVNADVVVLLESSAKTIAEDVKEISAN